MDNLPRAAALKAERPACGLKAQANVKANANTNAVLRGCVFYALLKKMRDFLHMSKRHIPMTMEDWAKRIDKFLDTTERPILTDAEHASAERRANNLTPNGSGVRVRNAGELRTETQRQSKAPESTASSSSSRQSASSGSQTTTSGSGTRTRR